MAKRSTRVNEIVQQLEALSAENANKRRELAVELIRWEQVHPNPHVSRVAFDRAMVWFMGDDKQVGRSSITMLAYAIGCHEMLLAWGADAPLDGDDFGRCYRLVQQVPEVKKCFAWIGEMVPVFAGILEHWDELCDLYDREIATRKAHGLYERIQALRAEAGGGA